jgi:hypothetical protein
VGEVGKSSSGILGRRLDENRSAKCEEAIVKCVAVDTLASLSLLCGEGETTGSGARSSPAAGSSYTAALGASASSGLGGRVGEARVRGAAAVQGPWQPLGPATELGPPHPLVTSGDVELVDEVDLKLRIEAGETRPEHEEDEGMSEG